MLEFDNQVDSERTLLMFWRAAMRLRLVTDELPSVKSFPISLKIQGAKNMGSLEKTLELASLANLEIFFSTLPEAQFEVLALRFRPFFAQNEKINFMNLLSLLDKRNPKVRPWTKSLRKRWRDAVFWGGMGMKAEDLPVETDRIISVGFYSKYFHIEQDKMSLADEYREKMGAEIFEVALISAVWERAKLVVGVANSLQPQLVAQGVLSQDEVDLKPVKRPEVVKLQLSGGPGALKLFDVGGPVPE
ncbi:MAG: hypothetical protein ACK41V_00460 [Acidovorax sp.]|uniref:hypothetical protein n=1 Tax=Acidovorax sp. TaxID=1872122 RepID=UPI00391AFF09